jgi:hypothetical protein
VAEDGIYIHSGVSAFDGKPFCAVRWGNLSGQLSPDEVRMMALHWMEAAAAAEQDALVMAELQEGVGLDLQTAGAVLVALRKRREITGG